MDIEYLKRIVEGALLAAGNPLSLNQLNSLFPPDEQPGHGPLREALAALDAELADRAVELKEVGSGFRLQIRSELMPAISQLWTEKPPKYSRALLETLAIIAYRQPITRGEIEQIRGVSVSSNILRTLQERDWIKVIGHRDVPGRPELIGTTKAFLDYFNLKSLDELPTLAEIKDIDNLEPELELQHPASDGEKTGSDKDHEKEDAAPNAGEQSDGQPPEETGDEPIDNEPIDQGQIDEEGAVEEAPDTEEERKPAATHEAQGDQGE